jgi:energy-coupling factor transporter ATP-binding protein EcfA2
MVSKRTVEKTIARLEQAIASGVMPPEANNLAERICKRLRSPVRLAIMGPQGAGKSQLLNFLAGADVIPKDARLPSTLIAWGEAEKVDCTLANGKVKSLKSFDIEEINQLKPVFVRRKMPLPMLKSISLLEVVTGTKEAEQKRALAWAARSTDIALWCTQEFTEAESELWNTLPSILQDHSFLIQTKADRLKDKSTRENQLEMLRSAASDQFYSVHQIETLRALAARDEDGEIADNMLAQSGGQDLHQAVMKAIDEGIQASLDGAVILFARYDISENAMAAPVAPVPEEQKQADAPPDEPTELLVPKQAPTPRPGIDDVSAEIVKYLTDRVKELQAQLSKSDALDSEVVLAQCFKDVEWLVDQLSAKAEQNPDILHTLDACQDAADMMLLLQLENHDSAVEDAVVLLLQIKRDFEQKLAA